MVANIMCQQAGTVASKDFGTGAKAKGKGKGQGPGQTKGKGKGKGTQPSAPQTPLTPNPNHTWICLTCKKGNRYLDAEKCYRRECQAPNPYYHHHKATSNEVVTETTEQTAAEQAKAKQDKRLKAILGPFPANKLKSLQPANPDPMEEVAAEPVEATQEQQKQKKKELQSKLDAMQKQGLPQSVLRAMETEMEAIQIPEALSQDDQLDKKLSKALATKNDMVNAYANAQEAEDKKETAQAAHAKLAQDQLTTCQNNNRHARAIRAEAMLQQEAEIKELEDARSKAKVIDLEDPTSCQQILTTLPQLPPAGVEEKVVLDYLADAPQGCKPLLEDMLALYRQVYGDQQSKRDAKEARGTQEPGERPKQQEQAATASPASASGQQEEDGLPPDVSMKSKDGLPENGDAAPPSKQQRT